MPEIVGDMTAGLDYEVDSSELAESKNILDDLFEGIDKVAIQAGALGATLTAMAGVVTNKFKEFGTAVNRLRAAYGLSEADTMTAALERQALVLGDETATGWEEATEAQLEMARAGFTVQENLAAMPAVLDLVVGGLMSTGDAAAYAKDMMETFGYEVSQVPRIADVLARSSTAAVTSFTDMAAALRQVSAVAVQEGVNLSLEQTASTIVALRRAGLDTARVGEYLAKVFSWMRGSGNDARATIRDLGTTIEELWSLRRQGDIGGLLSILSAPDLDKVTRTRALVSIFGDDFSNVADKIYAASLDYELALDKVNGASGEANRIAEIMGSGVPGAFEAIASAIDNFQIALGQAGVSEGATAFLGFLTNLINKFQELPGWVQGGVAKGLLGLIAALSVLSFVLGGATVMWRLFKMSVLDTTKAIWKKVAAFGGSTAATNANTASVAANMKGLRGYAAVMAAKTAVTNVNTASTTANSAAAASQIQKYGVLGVLIRTLTFWRSRESMATARGTVKTVAHTIATTAQSVATGLLTAATAVATFFIGQKGLALVKSTAAAVAHTVATWAGVVAGWADVAATWAGVSAFVAKFFATVKLTVATWLWVVAQWAQFAATVALTVAGWALAAVMAVIAVLNPFAWVAVAIAAIGALIFVFIKFRTEIFDWLKKNWPLLAGILFPPFMLFGVFLRWRDKIIGFFKDVIDWVKNIWPTIARAIAMPFIAAFNFVVDVVKGIIAWLGDAVGTWIWNNAVWRVPALAGQDHRLLQGRYRLGEEYLAHDCEGHRHAVHRRVQFRRRCGEGNHCVGAAMRLHRYATRSGSIPVVGKVAQAPNVFRDPSTPPTGSVSVAGSGPRTLSTG